MPEILKEGPKMSFQVLHLIGGGEIGGAEQHILNLLKNFNQQQITPHLGCLVKNSPFATLARSQGIKTTIFTMRFPLDIGPVIPLIRYCRTHKIDLIHCHGARAALLGRLTGKLLSLANLSTIHSWPEFDYTSVWKGRLARFVEQKTLPWSSGIITVSDALQITLRDKTNPSLPLRSKTIYNGIPRYDFSEHQIMRSCFRQQWGIKSTQKVIGTIGRLHPVKGQIYLAEAIKALCQVYADLHLLIIGDGPLRSELQSFLTANNISYTITGYYPAAWRALPAMDIFALPSVSEGMGLVLLEAAQAKVPIVASNTGGIPELFNHRREALLCRPADSEALAAACREILDNPDLAKMLIENAWQISKLFTIDRMVKDTTNFYLEILTNKS